MSAAAAADAVVPRPCLAGVRQIVRLNWPWYAAAVAVGAGGLLAGGAGVPCAVACAAAALGATTLLLALASLVAAAWIYDVSPLRGRLFVRDLLPRAPRRWVNLHCGLDDTSDALRRLFPGAQGLAVDVFEGREGASPSIRRARALAGLAADATPGRGHRVPVADGTADAVTLVFSAHEVRRRAAREDLFREVSRVLAADGAALVVEHVRDCANFAAFGPGALHFQPASEWRRLAALAGLEVDLETRITPFVRVLRLRRSR